MPFDLADGQEHEIVFTLGVGRDSADAANLLKRFRGSPAARAALEAVCQYWTHTLGAVQVETPDPALDVLTNGWLLYQTLACRLWARSGFYQSGGAFGFRDQLQDAMALVHAEPRLLREHLLPLCGPSVPRETSSTGGIRPRAGACARTVRTIISGCRWQRAAMSRAPETPACWKNPFLPRRPPSQRRGGLYYDLPRQSEDAGSLYEHCTRAILHGLRLGHTACRLSAPVTGTTA